MNKLFLAIINGIIKWAKNNISDFKENEISDGYHTFNELYEFRKVLNAALFNEWALQYDIDYPTILGKYSVHKSWKHNDGKECFPDSKDKWFIVSAMLPYGLISNHYKEKDWDLFKLPVVDKALFKFDGHTGNDVLLRFKSLISNIA